MASAGSQKKWLMKAEPDSRIVKGKDVKFSVDDFEQAGTTPWEGVRNYEARNLMQEMQIGDQILFYHSNCKNPGIAGFAEVSRTAFPDHTAWDPSHPYYDAKTDEGKPRWFMVEAKFIIRAANFVPLALLRKLASSSEVPPEVSYIGADGLRAIKSMALVSRGRLSIQRVEEEAWIAIEQLASQGGFDDIAAFKATGTTRNKKGTQGTQSSEAEKKTSSVKRRHETDDAKDDRNLRRSQRTKR